MTQNDDAYETPKWRTLWLGVGFGVVVAVGVATVLLPALEDEPSEESATSQDEMDTPSEGDKTPSE